MDPIAPRPRLGFILTGTMLILFYGVFAYSTLHLMRAMHQFAAPGAMTLTHELPQSDYARFWFTGRSLLARYHLAPPPSPVMFPLNILSPSAPPLKAWLYPPPMAMLASLFAWAPLPLSFWLWRAASLVLGALVLRYAGLRWAVIAAGLASPAALHDAVAGQNGTLLGAILVAALLLAERQKPLAGLLAGLLVLKPQIALAVPASWLHPRFARAAAAAALMGLVMVLLSAALTGLPAWVQFFSLSRRNSEIIIGLPFASFFPIAGITPFYMMRSLGAAAHMAGIIQACISLAALSLVWLGWRPGVMQMLPRAAFTVSLSLLAMPYGFSYELVGFSIAMAALFFRAGEWQRLILALLWLLGGYTITIADYTGLLLFPLWAAGGAAMAWWIEKGQGSALDPPGPEARTPAS